jgi:hypothetical protein
MPDTILWLTPKRARLTRTSPISGPHTMDLDISQRQWALWESGRTLIQRCFPQLTASEREFIQSGLTQEDWDKIFPPEKTE